MFLQEIELRAQNTLTIPGSIVNMIGWDLYDQLNEWKDLYFDNEQDS